MIYTCDILLHVYISIGHEGLTDNELPLVYANNWILLTIDSRNDLPMQHQAITWTK